MGRTGMWGQKTKLSGYSGHHSRDTSYSLEPCKFHLPYKSSLGGGFAWDFGSIVPQHTQRHQVVELVA